MSSSEQKKHPSYLAHHYDTPEQQYASGKLGMWLFLATEILLFAGLFCAYAIYRSHHPEIFLYAHQFLDKQLGGINTVVLITSSFTMAMAVRSAQLGQRSMTSLLLVLTLVGAVGFLGIKKIEYESKWKHGLLWGERYRPVEHGAAPAGEHGATGGDGAPGHEMGLTAGSEPSTTPEPSTSSDSVIERSARPSAAAPPPGLAHPAEEVADGGHAEESPKNVHLFFGIYFLMTGLHGVHVIAGMIAIGWALFRNVRGDFSSEYSTPVDLVGLYWHLVDLIWIFLFPLLYLIH